MRPALPFATCLLVVCLAPPAAQGISLPPGFSQRLLVDGLAAPMAMAWAPDQHLWIAGQRDIWVAHLEEMEPELVPIARLPTSSDGERGIIGIAIDPDFTSNRHVWVFYTTAETPVRNRLSRFRNVGDQIVDERVILETPFLESNVHNGGCLRFASDKSLFISTGDDLGGSRTSQDSFDLRGKILHINRDGSPSSDNPFLDGESGDPRVWAIGLRNPWRFNLQPDSGNLFIADVGGSRFEELNLGVAGANFGWRLTEGPEPAGVEGVTYPLYFYPHTDPAGHAIIGGDHARDGSFPSEFVGNYFFADSVTREIFRMVLDTANAPLLVETFASELSYGAVDLQFGPDGALYYLSFGRGALYEIRWVGGVNRQPTAVASATPDNGKAPLEVTLDGSGSYDPDGGTLSYFWELGDGRSMRGRTVRASYPPGEYRAVLTVTDAAGASAKAAEIRIVSGNQAPDALIQEPLPARLYQEGEVIAFSGMGLDPEEGILDCGRLTWRVIFHHLEHTHPFLGPLPGACEGSFIIDSHGETQTFYEIRLDVRDHGVPLGSVGTLSATRSIEIYPKDASRGPN